jgi:hypothetical protein
MSLALPPEFEQCGCGALYKDLGRFGSKRGDESVRVYLARHRETNAYLESPSWW